MGAAKVFLLSIALVTLIGLIRGYGLINIEIAAKQWERFLKMIGFEAEVKATPKVTRTARIFMSIVLIFTILLWIILK